MERRRLELLALVLMSVSVLAVVILVANLDDTDLGGNDGSSQEMVDDIVNGLLPIALVLVGVLFVYVVISLFSKRSPARGPAKKENGSSILSLLIMMAGIIIISLVLIFAGPLGGDLATDGGNSTNGTIPDPDYGDQSGTTFNSFTLIGVMALVIIVMIPLFRYLKGQGAFSRDKPSHEQPEQIEILDQAMMDIGSDELDLRATVLRTYYEMCRLIPSIVDHTALTPREFAELSVRNLGWPERAVRGLTEVFEVARYSHHELGEDDRAKALACLAEIKEKVVSEVTTRVGTAEPAKG